MPVRPAQRASSALFSFETLFDNVPMGVYVVDADFRLTHANPIASKVFGGRGPIGQDFDALIRAIWPQTYAEEIVARFRHTLETGDPYFVPERIEERIDLAETQSFEWQINRIHLPDGRDGVVCYFRDVSERVATQSRLAQSERRYRDLFNSIDEGYCVVEMIFDAQDQPVDYRFLEVNEAFEQQSGLHSATGKRMLELAPDHEPHWFEIYGKVAQTGQPVRLVQSAKALDRWFDLYAFRLGGAESRKVAVVFSDITNRLQSEQALKESEERYRTLFNSMAELHRQKDEFLAMLSHELRNPLAPLWNAAQLLRLKNFEDVLQQQACGIIERQVGNLKHLVDDLLEVSRFTTGRVRLRHERIALGDIVKRAVETTAPLIESRRHALEVDFPVSPVWLHGDAARLEQVIVNLLTNAAKYTPEGGQIWLSGQAEEANVLLKVRDTGVGIGEDLLPRVFDFFSQAERSLDRADGGLGIGLSLVKRLVELHGGTVTVTSTVGKGSEFVLRLPVMLASLPGPIALPGPSVVAGVKKGLRVLVVDDNIDGAQILAILLASSGHDTRMAHDGLSAVRMAEEFGPDIVLLDIGLPGLNGYEVAKQIRRKPALKDITLVAMTGYGQDADKQLAEQAGMDHHLVKPADFLQVERLLSTLK